MTDGDIEYAGKYSAPDYEAICDADCDLALESTMIYHTPKVKEQLERLGIPVLVERSSYESNPLGRMEWIKLYGVLTGKEEQAEALYDEQLDALAPILDRRPPARPPHSSISRRTAQQMCANPPIMSQKCSSSPEESISLTTSPTMMPARP